MILKLADDKTADLATLHALLEHPAACQATVKHIEREIRTIKSGIKGENDTAYEIDFHFGQSTNWAVIHDLRLEFGGRVAQLDHVLIDRCLNIWVIESKRLMEGIAINEQGECATFWNGKPHGIASPHEQNAKHLKVLRSVFAEGGIELPTRLGFAITPNCQSLVVVSKNARISRPATSGWWQESLIKADQISAHIGQTNVGASVLQLLNVVSSETLKELAWKLAALHTPLAFDWHGKFGLSPVPKVAPPTAQIPPVSQRQIPPAVPASPPAVEASAPGEESQKSRYFCFGCRAGVTEKVAKFCWTHKVRFGGHVYCFNCQPKFPKE